MSNEGLRKTIRRSVAFLSIPLWIIVLQIRDLAEKVAWNGHSDVLTYYVPWVMIMGCVVYLFVLLRSGSDLIEDLTQSGRT